MNTKRFFVILLIVSLAFALLACSRSASEGPEGSTDGTNPPVPATALPDDGMNQMGTQTAVAETPPPAFTATPPSVEPTATIAPPPPQEKPETYTLHKGEFPYCLARRFNVNPNDLLSLNGLSSTSATFVGQVLKIPASGSFPGTRSLNAHPTTYTVRSGDSIYTIACYYGDVYPESIAAVNNLQEPYTITAGQSLSIP